MKKGGELTLKQSKGKGEQNQNSWKSKSAPVKINQQNYCGFNFHSSLLFPLLTL